MSRHYMSTINDQGDEVAPFLMRCNDCGRPAYWDEGDLEYHHAVDAARGCFLISPEDRADDEAHPLVGADPECADCGCALTPDNSGVARGVQVCDGCLD